MRFNNCWKQKRAPKPGGCIIIVVPYAPGVGAIFRDHHKHGWIVSRKRLVDMAEEVGFEIVRTRYSIGWITPRQGPVWAFGQVIARFTNAMLNLPLMSRLLESIRLDNFAEKVKRTIIELDAVEQRKSDGSIN